LEDTNVAAAPKIYNLVHSRIAGGPELFCGWPWTGGIHNFGDGEIIIAYTEKPCSYKTYEDTMHGEAEARLILCRTLDGGQSWPEDMRQILRDNHEPFDEWIHRGGEPRPLDMTGKDAALIFWRSFSRDPWWTPEGQLAYRPVSFVMRSTDRGHYWHMPAVIVPHYHMDSIYGGTNYVRLPSGTILAGIAGYRYPAEGARDVGATEKADAERTPQDESRQRRPSRAALYISRDQGLNWYYFSTIAYEDRDDMDCGYSSLVLLPGGRLLCAVGYRFVRGYPHASSWTSVTYSDDGGRSWAPLHRINDLGDQANLCRLSDGRIVCIYGHRFVPYGLRGMLSEDDGKTWGEEFVIRADGAGPDLGYPVVTELPDGRILTVYYFNVDDGIDVTLLRGGRRFIAASTFRLP
jgi:hypothetical protein